MKLPITILGDSLKCFEQFLKAAFDFKVKIFGNKYFFSLSFEIFKILMTSADIFLIGFDYTIITQFS